MPDADATLEQSMARADPDLLERMTRLANSPFPVAPATIQRAIREIGFRPVHSAAIAIVVAEALRRPMTHLSTEGYWSNAIAVGMVTTIAAAVEGVHHDDAFAAGLLHRMGVLLLDQYAPQAFDAALRRAQSDGRSIDDAIVDEMGFPHTELAASVAIHWALPARLVQSIAYPAQLTEALNSPRSLEGLVFRARTAAPARGFPEEFAERGAPESRAVWLVERPLLALDRLGGREWLQPRVQAMLDVALGDRGEQ